LEREIELTFLFFFEEIDMDIDSHLLPALPENSAKKCVEKS
jgi:hypothetical protein